MAGPRSQGLVPASIAGRAISTENAYRCCQGGGMRAGKAIGRILSDIFDTLSELRTARTWPRMGSDDQVYVVGYLNAPTTLPEPPPSLRPGQVRVGNPAVDLRGVGATAIVIGAVSELMSYLGEIPALNTLAALTDGLTAAVTVGVKEAEEGCESCIRKSMWKRKEKQVWETTKRRRRI